MNNSNDALPVDRRAFLKSGSALLYGSAVSGRLSSAPADAAPGAPAELRDVPMTLNVNGVERHFCADVRTTLLDALRSRLHLVGSKKGCDHGQCGACTVHVEGRCTLACLTLAIAVQNQKITTVEGLESHGHLHAMQQAFIDNDAFQCGYCTPGQIMSAIACVQEGYATRESDIREYMSGNLCRCAAYPNIVAAIQQASPLIRKA